jgi:hypothetical protein
MRSFWIGSAVLAVVLAGCGTKTIIIRERVVESGDAKAKQTDEAGPTQQIATDGDGSDAHSGEQWGILPENLDAEYAATIEKVANMPNDAELQNRVARRGLALVNVTWEDTGRSQGSALGPNISDLSLQVRRRSRDGFAAAVMPVVRFPNFTDRTGDVPASKFFVRVGNHKPSGELHSVPLTDVLRDLKAFATLPRSIRGDGNLLAPRDSHFLVSAQAVFLPIPKRGKAEFNPVLFNYQSAPGTPAVLTLLVTREGTSMQVIENRGEDATAAGWGQELYFNNKGQRSAFTAERKSDVEQRIAAKGGPKTAEERSALQKGADVLFMIQIPLKHANAGVLGGAMPPPMPMAPSAAAPMAEAEAAPKKKAERSDVEQAVLGHGPNLGPFNEGRNLKLERDPKFPIRITVQFYKATSNGVVSDQDIDNVSRSIGGVYEHADFVGSLVLPEGDPRRPTAWQKIPREWFPW